MSFSGKTNSVVAFSGYWKELFFVFCKSIVRKLDKRKKNGICSTEINGRLFKL